MRTASQLPLVLALLAVTAARAQTPTTAARERASSKDVQDAEPALATASPTTSAAAASPSTPRPATVAAMKATVADRAAKAQDRLELETTQITGNRELPKVMVIVPWKRSDIGDLAGRPVNSLVDEALQPVDRAEFRREIDYYSALAPDRPRDETHVTAGAAKERPEK